MQGLLPYVVRRLLWAPVILLAVSFIIFCITRFGPGDPIRVAMGQYSDPEVLARIRHTEGLDKSLPEQYFIYVKNLALHGQLGDSYVYKNRDVSELIFPRMWISAQIGLIALLIIFAVGIPMGVFAALRQGTWTDPFSIAILLLFLSVPVLIAVPAMQYLFVLKLHWLPTGGWACSFNVGPLSGNACIGIFSKRLIMPVLAISLPGIAGLARLTRATTLSVLREDYVRTARAKGLSQFTVLRRHVLRNSLLPLVTVIGISLVSLVEGALFTETLLGISGIGQFAFQSVNSRDYNVIMALTLILAATFIVANIAIDIAYTIIDPRIRYERGRTQ
ncbi:MAG: ABC transporter permease [Dehalococcoidia bacterium]|jgi:ABC-type dipeptide/oligopeptide/nickel transport system permease component